MNLHYLSYLAELAATNLHPYGRRATDRLVACLNLPSPSTGLKPSAGKPGGGYRVLEIGCGTAETMVRIALSHAVAIDGVDVLPEMLRVARTRLRLAGVRGSTNLCQQGIGSSLPFADQTYDRVYTESVLGFQDATAAQTMLAEIFRVLKTKGLYVANEGIWKRSVSEEVVSAINQVCLADFGLRQASEHAWSIDHWLSLISDVGFKIVVAEPLEVHTTPDGSSERGFSWGLVLSAMLTRYSQLKSFLIPELIVHRAKYRRLLKKHRSDGQYIEGRLFVLERP